MASKAQGRETRERLIRAARKAFAELGYESTSLNTVASAAGVTRQALLHYFPTKADLLKSVLDEAELEFRQYGWESESGEVGWAEGLVAILRHNVEAADVVTLYSAALAAGVHAESALHDFVRERERRIHRDMLAAVEHEQAAGRLTSDMDAEALAVALRALFTGLLFTGLLDSEADVTSPLAGVLRALSA